MEPDPIFSLLPLIFVTLVLFFLSIPISRRKGRSVVYPLLCLIPIVAFFIVVYLASLTDKQVLDRLAALERGR